ncbi:thiosulfate/3-mercaptopyruvate sulfurtransferase [Roseateles sp. YR242]|uniref:sulfurtransferase n=1 Tax=Roseateles sp. YR242 TaxID=1855305 RepID=UPI0008C1DE8A|nr:sulfurtransferase [Roseateles sp. YR242]SEL87975.1 thiosulfate/3-mercaptopyruvate sulfurtransferase [Roseateles sp. YR242]
MTDTAFTSLIHVEALRAQLAAPKPPLVIDVRFDLANTALGEEQYTKAHIPGAHYLHLDRDLSGPRQVGDVFHGRHPLPDREAFAALLRRLGLRTGQQVVAYDGGDGMYAARVWWMLRWLGHDRVAVLDGGWAAWLAANGTTTDVCPEVGSEARTKAGAKAATENIPQTDPAAPLPAPGDFTPGPSLEQPWSKQELLAGLGRVRLVDARAGERFRGEVEPLDRQAGHIPGASHRFFKSNLDGNGRFKPAELLKAEFQQVLGGFSAQDTVHQCGSGVTACHNLLAMHHAGLTGSRLYPGSWSEWSADPRLPLARG